MWFLHYIIPGLIYFFNKNKIMFWGLISGNILDLDKIYFRLIGKVGWTESICEKGIGTCSSIGNYPLHTLPPLIFLLIALILFLFFRKKNKKLSFLFWFSIGAILHLFLDCIQKITGIVI